MDKSKLIDDYCNSLAIKLHEMADEVKNLPNKMLKDQDYVWSSKARARAVRNSLNISEDLVQFRKDIYM